MSIKYFDKWQEKAFLLILMLHFRGFWCLIKKRFNKKNSPHFPSNHNYSKKNELCTVKFRYKQPDSSKSTKIERVVFAADEDAPENNSENFLWSAAFAEFGMLIRDSAYKSEASYKHCLELAKKGAGKHEHGYRAEMIDMIDSMKKISRQ